MKTKHQRISLSVFSVSSKGGHDQRGRRADRQSDSLAGRGEQEEEEGKTQGYFCLWASFHQPLLSSTLHVPL